MRRALIAPLQSGGAASASPGAGTGTVVYQGEAVTYLGEPITHSLGAGMAIEITDSRIRAALGVPSAPYLLSPYTLSANSTAGATGPSGTWILTAAMMQHNLITSNAPSAPTTLCIPTRAALGLPFDSSAPTYPFALIRRDGLGTLSIVPLDATATHLDFGGVNNDDWDPLTLDAWTMLSLSWGGTTTDGHERVIIRGV